MLNYYENYDFNKTVYAYNIETKSVKAFVAKDLFRMFAEETTTPRGIGPKFHTRGNELWTWGNQGNNPRLVEEFDTESEALHALYLSYKYDFDNDDDNEMFYEVTSLCFDTEEEAQAELAELLADLEE